ncbi:MobF family relaxase [Ornithinimicrobium panacihumi]|uniref:MobF family relaxase n=1 Tax=Ornithinimicrobium panacihumi TaxID=2008449 RepID=UPI003F89F3EE
MTIHKLTAGTGYDYLTRQVARQDATEVGHAGLASYYTDKGESPGVWVGSGMAGIEGLAAGDVVTAQHMENLFGMGLHPLADVDDLGPEMMLGRAYPVIPGDSGLLRKTVAGRLDKMNRQAGLPAGTPVDFDTRARVRTQVATELFRAEHGRDPEERELAGTIAKHSRPTSQAVAGYDLTFSPVKSVSALWAVADQATAAKIELAHQAAVKDALAFLETHALFTRTGAGGARQVDVTGLVATAFTHRDSRAGDPDLHTHVAVANKVQTLDGKWLAIDGRVLFKATVTASETYNTALEQHLGKLGLTFAERPSPDARTRPVREVVGVPAELNSAWSTRRADIEARRDALARDFQVRHGRPPTAVEAVKLAQQATLDTRQDKHEPRSLAQQRAQWAAQARAVLGGDEAVSAMFAGAFTRGRDAAAPETGPGWVEQNARRIIDTIQESRGTWQVWHVRAEAQRVVRYENVPLERAQGMVDALVDQALGTCSTALPRPRDVAATAPDQLHRVDGSSVYEVAGSALFTSAQVIAAEEYLLDAARQSGGRVAAASDVAIALLEMEANGVRLNPGQQALVRGMATSGARLQLAIAPAGSGKTTAMAALSRAWESGGGNVIGLAPSAAAAEQLRDQIGTRTDTLTKLIYQIDQAHPQPTDTSGGERDQEGLVNRIGRRTLVVIDEAGMADTLSLRRAVEFVTSRGGSVRLIGDDRQLAAIGAGGVLRDIEATHGSLRLTELLRFRDPAEGAATLALREGDTSALGFYLDQSRVHVGDMGTMAERVFTAWRHDVQDGKDSMMLAPTRDLVSELNRRARQERLERDGEVPLVTRVLSDGNEASPGDLIITRKNDRRLRTSTTDFVKNGDRWLIEDVTPAGGLAVRHRDSGLRITLPEAYVQASTELGYAGTVHTAQGLSVDTMHGLLGGQESRQQLYTMMTRGKQANHAYLEVVGDGDPHTLIHPKNALPPTATDVLEGILARDDAPRSVQTLIREQDSPAFALGQATARYTDALSLAAEQHLGTDQVARLEREASTIPDLVQAPAWPTLRAHLILIGANDVDPVPVLKQAANTRELDTASDVAAVIGWRLDDSGLRNAGPGPLPWVPAVPAALAADPRWGTYLTARADLVRDLADQVAQDARTGPTPPWAQQGARRPDPDLLADVQVWRAAHQIPDDDLRPTGPRQLNKAPSVHQRHLGQALQMGRHPALVEFGPLIAAASQAARRDQFAPVLADRLAGLSRAGIDPTARVTQAMAEGALPDDHAAAALWWRIARTLTPAVAHEVDTQHELAADWMPQLVHAVGTDRARQMQDSPWWPPLVSTVDQALARGWRTGDLFGQAAPASGADVDDAQAMTWRISAALTDPAHEDGHIEDLPPADLYDAAPPPEDAPTAADLAWLATHPDQVAAVVSEEPAADQPEEHEEHLHPVAALALWSTIRSHEPDKLDYSEQELAEQWDRHEQAQSSPVPLPRLADVNQLALDYYETQLAAGWARGYLLERFGQDVTGHPQIHPGYAPAGWTTLLDHLRGTGVSDLELETAGLATRTRDGRLIDRFRDRAVFPIRDQDGTVLGFVGRRNPDHDDREQAGPKYLNTPNTPLFHKGDQLYGASRQLLAKGAISVLAEGPMDAHAITLATRGRYLGLAPLGTSLTETQARQLAAMNRTPIVATDGDLAGHLAAHRDFWLLAQHGASPQVVHFPEGSDPADSLERRGPKALTRALAVNREELHQTLLDERLRNLDGYPATEAALTVLAAAHPRTWDQGVYQIHQRTGTDPDVLRVLLVNRIRHQDNNPRHVAQDQLGQLSTVRQREASNHTPQQPGRRAGPEPATAARRHPGEMLQPTTPGHRAPGGPRRR